MSPPVSLFTHPQLESFLRQNNAMGVQDKVVGRSYEHDYTTSKDLFYNEAILRSGEKKIYLSLVQDSSYPKAIQTAFERGVSYLTNMKKWTGVGISDLVKVDASEIAKKFCEQNRIEKIVSTEMIGTASLCVGTTALKTVTVMYYMSDGTSVIKRQRNGFDVKSVVSEIDKEFLFSFGQNFLGSRVQIKECIQQLLSGGASPQTPLAADAPQRSFPLVNLVLRFLRLS